MSSRLAWLDPWVLRRPFFGRSATRYMAQRAGFGDLDRRLVAALAPVLVPARVVLDVGAGRGELAALVAAAAPQAQVVALEPSAAFAEARSRARRVRAAAEALPLADASVDVAVCVSSLRHVGDRLRAFAELRRVVRPGGTLVVVELDPNAEGVRRARHAAGIGSLVARAVFARLVLPSCPPAETFAAAARAAGWGALDWHPDPLQPVYIMRCA